MGAVGTVVGGVTAVIAQVGPSLDRWLDVVVAPVIVVVAGAIIAPLFARSQRRSERRDRTVQLWLHFDGTQMREDRRRCWDFLQGVDDVERRSRGPLSHYVPSEQGHVLEFRACHAVLTFYHVVRTLLDAKQVDPDLVVSLFEQSRANFAKHFGHMASKDEPNPHYRMLHRHLWSPLDGPVLAARPADPA